MSLVVYVSNYTVAIRKYRAEFPFKAPSPGLTKAAIEAYKILRQSEAIQFESTREEREEALQLLRQYGNALFRSIFPSNLSESISGQGGIFVFLVDREVMRLPC